MRRLTLTAFLGLTLLAAPAALAAGPKLTLTPHFSAALMPGYEQPVTVTLTNPADGAAFSGEVVLSQGMQQWQAPVTLPAGASVATVTLRVHYASRSWLSSKVQLRSTRGDVVAAQIWNPAVKPEGLLRVLVVSKDGSAGTWEGLNGQVSGVHRESGRLVPGGPRRVPGQVGMSRELPDEDYFSVVAATPSQLTEQASALAQFGIVVLTSEQGLSEAQKAALERWVNAGGILVHPEETDTAERVELLGAGRIVHTSATPSVKSLVAPRNYVGSLYVNFGQVEDYNSYSGGGLFPLVLKSSGMQAPPFSTIALFLGAYLLAVVPLQYLILRRLDKREWAWGTTPLLAGAFALGAYVVGGQGRSRTAFYNTAAVIETAAGRTTGAAVARFGLYSPDRTTYSLTAPTADTAFFRTVGDLASLSSDQVPGQPTRLQDFAVPQWAMRSVSLYTTDLPLGGGVTASLKHRGDLLEGTVTNNTGVTLESVQVHFGTGRVGTGRALIPNLAPGATQTVSLSFYGEETVLHGISGPPSLDNKEAARRFFPMLASSVPDEQPSVYGKNNRYAYVPRTNEALITALTSQELVPVTIKGGRATPRTTDSLLIIHVPIGE
ncbi:hypothetical protein [Armatimonas sp.]|uniref:hypothetical protein n=1 Tax=Armatimonas sp. TaxID=1872638 RepID=UPI00374D5D8A